MVEPGCTNLLICSVTSGPSPAFETAQQSSSKVFPQQHCLSLLTSLCKTQILKQLNGLRVLCELCYPAWRQRGRRWQGSCWAQFVSLFISHEQTQPCLFPCQTDPICGGCSLRSRGIAWARWPPKLLPPFPVTSSGITSCSLVLFTDGVKFEKGIPISIHSFSPQILKHQPQNTGQKANFPLAINQDCCGQS